MHTSRSSFISPDPIMPLHSGEARLTPSDGLVRRRVRSLFCAPSQSYPSLAELERLHASEQAGHPLGTHRSPVSPRSHPRRPAQGVPCSAAPGLGGWGDVQNNRRLRGSGPTALNR